MTDAKPFDVEAWLQEPISLSRRFEPAVIVPRHERICFLVAANGGFEFKGWGSITTSAAGHQQGLDQDDALHLIDCAAYLRGLQAGGVEWEPAFVRYWDAYRAKFTPPDAPAVEPTKLEPAKSRKVRH